MHITDVYIRDLMCFEEVGPIALTRINVLLGENNSGKSAFLRAIRSIQAGHDVGPGDVRLGASAALVRVGISGDIPFRRNDRFDSPLDIEKSIRLTGGIDNSIRLVSKSQGTSKATIPNREPQNALHLFLSKRKAIWQTGSLDPTAVDAVEVDFRNLPARIHRLSNISHPQFNLYRDTSERILGFFLGTMPTDQGTQLCRVIDNRSYIPIQRMGEGVINIAALLTDVCMAHGSERVFLLEEPENDLHPRALKALLTLLADPMFKSQIIVSTHSHIVARTLGSSPEATLFRVHQNPKDPLPKSAIQRINPTTEDRIAVLEELGYELSDFDIHEGWLILEESSAERLIREYLISWFAPKLAGCRTVSASGISKVEPTYEALHRLFLFTHLEERYRNKSFVLVDGDAIGKSAVANLRKAYSRSDPRCFSHFQQPDFELYYPAPFISEVTTALSDTDKAKKRARKKELLNKVIRWIDADRDRARDAFESSAADVINQLRSIEQMLIQQGGGD